MAEKSKDPYCPLKVLFKLNYANVWICCICLLNKREVETRRHCWSLLADRLAVNILTKLNLFFYH